MRCLVLPLRELQLVFALEGPVRRTATIEDEILINSSPGAAQELMKGVWVRGIPTGAPCFPASSGRAAPYYSPPSRLQAIWAHLRRRWSSPCSSTRSGSCGISLTTPPKVFAESAHHPPTNFVTPLLPSLRTSFISLKTHTRRAMRHDWSKKCTPCVIYGN